MATGVLYGVTASLTKLVVGQLAHGPTNPLAHWPLYVAVVTGASGIVVSQRAFQLGRLLAPVNAVISTVDPLVAVTIGLVELGEHTTTGVPAVLGELLAITVTVTGITLVARRGADILDTQDAHADRGHLVPWG